MGRWVRVAWLAGVALGCGDDLAGESSDPEPAAPKYAQSCGSDGPHRVLELQPGEYVFEIDHAPVGDRLLVGVFRIEPGAKLNDSADTSARAIMAAGPCGEDPVEVGVGLEVASPVGDVALACAAQGTGVYRIDPTGAEPPVLLVDAPCSVRRTDEGLVLVRAGADDETGDLVIIRDPAADNPQMELLLSGVGVPDNDFYGSADHRTTPLWAKGSEAMVLMPTSNVVEVDLVSGQARVVVEGVLDFRASSSGEYLLWQTNEPLEGDEDAPTSPVFLHDREAATDAYLVNTHLPWTASPFRSGRAVVRDDSPLGERIYSIPDGEEQSLPEGYTLRKLLGDDRFWLAKNSGDATQEYLWAPGSDPQLLVEHVFGHASLAGEGVQVYVEDEHPNMSEGALWFAPFDGAGAELVSPRVHFHHRRFADGRVLSIVDEDDNRHGSLRLQVPGQELPLLLDTHGYVHSPSLNGGDPLDGDLVWAADERDSGRRGLYRARLAE